MYSNVTMCYKGGEGGKKWRKFALRNIWTAPNSDFPHKYEIVETVMVIIISLDRGVASVDISLF